MTSAVAFTADPRSRLLELRSAVERALEGKPEAVELALIALLAGRLAEVQAHLNTITNDTYADLKKKIGRNLQDRRREGETRGTNAPPISAPPVAAPPATPR